MNIINPTHLVAEFKKSGEFDRLRRELLKQFQKGDGMEAFMARVEDIARQRLDSDQKLQYMPPEAVHRELMQEIDRYPLVERAVADVRAFSDPTFPSNIRESVQRILRQDRGEDGIRSPEAMDIDEDEDEPIPSTPPNPSTPIIPFIPPTDTSPQATNPYMLEADSDLDARKIDVSPFPAQIPNMTSLDSAEFLLPARGQPDHPAGQLLDHKLPRDADTTHVIKEAESLA